MPRPSRPSPKDLVESWPDARSDDPIGEVARQFTLNLRAAIGDRSLRAAAEAAAMDHSTIQAILQGRTWPDLYTVAKLEQGLGTDLWPGRGTSRT